jgi:putative membrane protein insertion efficiency factor
VVQISCRSNDVAAQGGVLHWSRPRASRAAKCSPSASQRTPSSTLTEQHNSSRSADGWDHTFEKRSDVRNESANVGHTGATTHQRVVSPMSAAAWQARMLRAIEWYQSAFQWRPSPCRFSPTCSHYSHEAISLHGPSRGLWLTVRRLVRCRPFGPSGFDPVPEVNSSNTVDHEPLRTP